MMTKNDEKKPRPYVREVEQEDLDWDPYMLEQYTLDPSAKGTVQPIRSGDSYAVCRPGHERWPLGHVSDVYRPTSHRRTVDAVLEACVDSVEPCGRPLVSGIGYRIVHMFSVLGEEAASVHGLPLSSRLAIVHDHTGLNALRARMVVYVGENPLGSVVGARAIHVADNPDRWRREVEGMVDRSKKAQKALLALLRAAGKRVLTEADKAVIEAMGTKPAGPWTAGTLLDACVSWHQGREKNGITWGVWSRALEDSGIRTMIKVLGSKEHGVPLDEALGGHRYGWKAAK